MAIALAGMTLLLVQWASGRPLWLDEEMIAINLRDRGFRSLIGELSLGQAAPYGWLVLQRSALLAIGATERALRLVPVAFGIGTIAVAMWIGTRRLSALGATTLVALCSFGQWLTFYFLELKHYSADAFFALALPALAARVDDDRRRLWEFWLAASVGLWLANGAVLVMPAATVALVVAALRGRRWNGVLRTLVPGVVWLASLALHYAVSLRHALGSEYLEGTWTFAFPPREHGLVAAAMWSVARLTTLASKPGGSELGILLFIAAIAGFVVAYSRMPVLATANALITPTAIALAIARLIPLYERISLWIVPSLYVGIALLADGLSYQRRVVRVALAPMLIVLAVEIPVRGVAALRVRPATSNRALDDRAAIRWLRSREQPGDAWLVTHFAVPALWWYGGHARTADTYELMYSSDSHACRAPIGDVFARHRRALVYLGFRFDDTPVGFDDLVVDQLSEAGAVTGYRRFAGQGIVLVLDARERAKRPNTLSQLDGDPVDRRPRAPGCVGVLPVSPR